VNLVGERYAFKQVFGVALLTLTLHHVPILVTCFPLHTTSLVDVMHTFALSCMLYV